MKHFICTSVFLLFSILGFSQKHSIGLNIIPSLTDLNEVSPTYRIIPLNPNFEISYIFQKTDKTSIVSGIGFAYQFFYSDYTDFDGRLHLDYYGNIAVPVEFRYNPVKWFYLGIGINNKIVVRSNGYVSEFPDYSYMFETTGSTGVQFDFKRFTYRLGLYTEVPLIHREYFNFGFETGLYYNFNRKK